VVEEDKERTQEEREAEGKKKLWIEKDPETNQTFRRTQQVPRYCNNTFY
jgi:hypothetical protein